MIHRTSWRVAHLIMNNNDSIYPVIDVIPGITRRLPEVQSSQLRPKEFWDAFVRAQQPVVIRGAAALWPVIEKWKDPVIFRSVLERSGTARGSVLHTMNPGVPWPRGSMPREPINEALVRLVDAPDTQAQSVAGFPVPENWKPDLGDFSFFQDLHRKAPRFNSTHTVFAYKNQSRDWHYHLVDEAITTQLRGSKRFSLFRLDKSNWHRYALLLENNYHLIRGSHRWLPPASSLTKYEATLEAGDAIYIPPFYWHAVEPVNHEFGVTLARSFATPMAHVASWREPMFRSIVQWLFRTGRARYLPAVPLLLALSAAARLWTGERWRVASDAIDTYPPLET
jgi:Cupin-like domain